MSKEKRSVPKLRFPGFTEDWEQRELSSLTEYIGTGKSRFVINEFGEYAILGSTNVIGYDDAYDYDGNFILTARVGANAGQLYRYSGKVKITDNTVFIMSDSSQFIYYTLTHFDLRRLSFGTGQPLVKSSELQKLELCVPVSKSEQEKIGEIFNKIDNIITLHQRKLEHLNLKKKALLQKLFPKNGERYPELRFPGFTDAWEQRKLGDFTNQINTFVNPEDAKLPLWSLTAEAGLIEKSDRYERDFLVKKKDQFKRIETNTLVYNPMNITIGSIDIYTGLYPIAVSGYYVSIVYDKNIDTDFLKEVLLLPSSLKMYKNYATGSLIERQRVQYPTFSKLQLLLPNLDEQKAIGQFFKSLNLDITLHQRKLEHLQLQKKALLQQMFV